MMPGYVFCLAPHLETEAKWLLQSIKLNTSAASDEIYIFVANSEKESIESLHYFQKNGNVITGNIPNQDYPLSALHRALEIAGDKSKNKYIICLDTDTFVISDVQIPATNADFMAVFDNDVGSFWARQESQEYWRKLHERYGISFENPIRWYNGGVIIVDTKSNFPNDWKKISDDIYNSISREKYFSEMIALGLLSNKYKFRELTENKNYIQGIHLDPPGMDTEIIHYIDNINLYRSSFNPRIRKNMEQTDVLADLQGMPNHKKYYRLLTSYMKAFASSHPNTFIASYIGKIDPSN